MHTEYFLVPCLGPVNVILSWEGWLPLARLSYVGYLLHPIIILTTNYTLKKQLYFTTWTMVSYYTVFTE